MASAALVALAACGGPARTTGGLTVAEADSAGVAVVTISGDASTLPEWRLSEAPLTVISGHRAPFLSDIGEVEFLGGGRLLAEDNRSAELHVFEANGEEVRRIGGAGDGPGEFRNLTELTVTGGDTVYTFDRRLSRISVFDPLGDLVTIVSVGREFAGPGTIALDAWAFDSEHLLLHSAGPIDSAGASSGPRLEQRGAVLDVLDSDGDPRSGSLRFRGGLSTMGQQFDGVSRFANESVVAVGADRIVRGSGVEYELFLETRDLSTRSVVRWPGWRQPLEDTLVQAVRDSVASQFAELGRLSPERMTALLDALFAPALVPATLPALGGALIDDQGRIWVSRFRPPTHRWSQEESWHVLDASGIPMARLRLPSQTRLAAVRDDRVALIMRDELEVQHIRVFRVVGGESR